MRGSSTQSGVGPALKAFAVREDETSALPGFAALLPAIPAPISSEPNTVQAHTAQSTLEPEAAKILKNMSPYELCQLPCFNAEFTSTQKRAGEFALDDLSHHTPLVRACVTLGKIHEYRSYEADSRLHPVKTFIERAAFIRKDPDSLRERDQSRSGAAIVMLGLIATAGAGIVTAAFFGASIVGSSVVTGILLGSIGAGAVIAGWIGFGNNQLESTGRGRHLDRMTSLKSELIVQAYRSHPGSARHAQFMQLDLPFSELKKSESSKVSHHATMLKEAIAKDPARFNFTVERLLRIARFFRQFTTA